MCRIGTNFPRAVRNWYLFSTVLNLRSVNFAVQQCYTLEANTASDLGPYCLQYT